MAVYPCGWEAALDDRELTDDSVSRPGGSAIRPERVWPGAADRERRARRSGRRAVGQDRLLGLVDLALGVARVRLPGARLGLGLGLGLGLDGLDERVPLL